NPQVAYTETIRTSSGPVEGKFVRQSGGRGQYGHVVIEMEPLPDGKGQEIHEVSHGLGRRVQYGRRKSPSLFHIRAQILSR
ncbi:hypothetical protein, partial [Acetomicrobium sp. S15 = DSM 107314]|uniref:hypothetical protein n=1 Tax=Acetomicrobium sp. S15 = DSM 107314 TaxID=2529858 RepID=UPI001E58D10E